LPRDYEQRFQDAVRDFWTIRGSQAERQRLEGKLDAGTRGAVTGGAHLNSVALLLADVFTDAGIHPFGNFRTLPGYYRASKNWDVVVTYKGVIVAIIELKSQVGSFGNNFNNRVEEMIGQSLDLWRAAREGLLGEIRPWFGYVMVLESDPRSSLTGRQIRHCLQIQNLPTRATSTDIRLPSSACALKATWTPCACLLRTEMVIWSDIQIER